MRDHLGSLKCKHVIEHLVLLAKAKAEVRVDDRHVGAVVLCGETLRSKGLRELNGFVFEE